MNLKEKYGEWGIIIGATEGVGKAMAQKIAKGKMNPVLVGRRGEKLEALKKEIETDYGVKAKVLVCDLSEVDAANRIIKDTTDLDIGMISYVACLHKFGKLQDTSLEDHKKMLQVNVITFLELFHHYMGIFAKKKKGLVVNFSSLTGITSSPYNAQYGAGKSYIKKLTEAVAYEARNDGIDVCVATLGSTKTPSFLSNLPGGEEGQAATDRAMDTDDVIDEIFENIGKVRSLVVGETNRETVKHWYEDMSADEQAEYMGKFYER
ncbi:MAG: SDR family NAD(P)-dependent oxidoreductase [Tissierellia bacterium]|nr:SDR family NAD(P)-dependent oxidoreductase [Tissierellia bacterium]